MISMQFNKVFTEESYISHLDFLNRGEGQRLVLRDADLQNADLQNADLRNADLRNADLRNADLRNADLRNADLRNCIGNNKEVKSLQFGTYLTVISLDKISIGCKIFTREKWFSFDDLEISEMATDALDWWKVYKPILQMICKASPVEKEKK